MVWGIIALVVALVIYFLVWVGDHYDDHDQ